MIFFRMLFVISSFKLSLFQSVSLAARFTFIIYVCILDFSVAVFLQKEMLNYMKGSED